MNKITLTVCAFSLFLVPLAPGQKPPDPPKQFAKADRDGDGRLTLAEFQGKKPKNAERRAKRFAKLDGNKDGALTLQEYQAGLKRKDPKKQ